MASALASSPDNLSVNKILDELMKNELSESSSDDETASEIQKTSTKLPRRPTRSPSSSWPSGTSSSSSASPSLSSSSSSSSSSASLSSSVAASSSSRDEDGPVRTSSRRRANKSSATARECRSLPDSPIGSLSSILDSPKRLSQSCPKPALSARRESSPSSSDSSDARSANEFPDEEEDRVARKQTPGGTSCPREATDSSGAAARQEEELEEDDTRVPPLDLSDCPSKDKGKDMRTLKVDLFELSSRPDDQRTPSPLFGRRSPVGALGWRPVMPGYQQPKSDGQKLAFSDGRDSVRGDRPMSRSPDMSLKDYIPAMSRPMAITCFVLNVVSPGLGTLLAGVSVLFCSTPRPVGIDRAQCLWVNTWVSVLQLLTTFLVLLGWIWSVMWGVAFLSVSGRVGDEKEHTTESAEVISPRSANVDGASEEARDGGATTRSAAPGPHSHRGFYQPESCPVPMIILHENPLALTSGAGAEPLPSARISQRTLNPYNPRHQRVIRRQEEELLPSYLLDGQALENIVIRNAPVPDQIVFGRAETTYAEETRSQEGASPKGYAAADLESYGDQLAPSTSRSVRDAAGSRRSRSDSTQRLL